MILKIHRLGHTEAHLLIVYYLKHVFPGPLDEERQQFVNRNGTVFTKWLWGTGGFYDKSFDLSGASTFSDYPDTIQQSPHFQRYLAELWRAVHESSYCQWFMNYPYLNEITALLEPTRRPWPEELGSMDPYNGLWWNVNLSKRIFDAHKRCLIVSPFAPLFEEQFKSGRYTQLWKNPCDNMNGFEHLLAVQFPFCFVNNGPDANFWETLDRMFAEIQDVCRRENIDLVCLSCGCYGHILVDRIVSHLNISAVYFGSALPKHFGIDFLPPHKEIPTTYVAENWILSCPPELQFERRDVCDIQRYFGR
ncbi:hypothetical protein EBZ80_14540 [bacterium]|nr:hypothetical protein [bacterium]